MQRICLDFGTAFSKASARLGASARPLAIGAAAGGEHPLLAPSVIFVDEGRVLFGPPAMTRARASDGARDPFLSFKTILAARDLEPALDLRVRPSVDPTRVLRQRDVLILYLAYLDRLLRRCIGADPALPASLADAPRRYTSPIWRSATEGDRVMSRLFDEAALVAGALGDALLAADGASIAHARAALEKASTTLGIGQLEAGVFEAHAATAAYAAFSVAPRRFLVVIDMGAGTTDLAGFERIGGQGQLLSEIAEARQSCGLAGDEIDDILANLLMERATTRDRDNQARAWRKLRLEARELKRDLFESGRCSVQVTGKRVRIKAGDLLQSPRFRDFQRALIEICTQSINAVAARAHASGVDEIGVLLAGGGANLAFMPNLAATALQRADLKVRGHVERFGEGWILPEEGYASLAGAAPQVAISLGGALAELETRMAQPSA